MPDWAHVGLTTVVPDRGATTSASPNESLTDPGELVSVNCNPNPCAALNDNPFAARTATMLMTVACATDVTTDGVGVYVALGVAVDDATEAVAVTGDAVDVVVCV